MFGPFPNKSNRMVMGGIQISKSQIWIQEAIISNDCMWT